MRKNVHTFAETDKEVPVLEVTCNTDLSKNLEIRKIKSSFLILSDKLMQPKLYQKKMKVFSELK